MSTSTETLKVSETEVPLGSVTVTVTVRVTAIVELIALAKSMMAIAVVMRGDSDNRFVGSICKIFVSGMLTIVATMASRSTNFQCRPATCT